MTAIWDDWAGAEAYREYVETYPLYSALNRRLAALADLERARRMLDLGCGTGLTTAVCLERLPEDAEVVGIDGAVTMVEIARTRVRDPRVRFRCAEISELERAVSGTFDRAVCNAALWLFPRPRRVLAELRDLLTGDGRLVFNLPAERLEGSDTEPDPFQRELAAALLGSRGERQLHPPLFDLERVESALEAAGLRLVRLERHSHVGRQEELIELMKIPAMTARLAPDRTPAERQRIVYRAAERCDPELEVEVPWLYFVVRPVLIRPSGSVGCARSSGRPRTGCRRPGCRTWPAPGSRAPGRR